MEDKDKSLIEEEEEYLSDFIQSADRIITKLRNDISRFKHHNDSIEIINSLFRGFHNLKSSAYSLRLPTIRRIAHHIEDILDLLRDKKITYNNEIENLLTEAVDIIDEILISLFEKGIEGQSRVAFIMKLKEFVKEIKKPEEKNINPQNV